MFKHKIKKIPDPYFAGKIKFTANSSSKSWVIISIFIICTMGFAVYHFFPDIIHTANIYFFPQVSQSADIDVSPTATEVQLPPKHVTKTEVQPPPKHATTTAVQSPPNKDITTTETQPSSDNTSTSHTILPILKEPQISDETIVLVEQSPTESPTLAIQPASSAAELLLSTAKKQITRNRLTSPKGDNAHETYQKLSKIDPQSAPQLLNEIIAWYYKQGQKQIRRNRLTSPKKYNAYKVYKTIQQIAPRHPSVKTLFREIFVALNQQAERQLKQDRYDNAYTTYQEMLVIAPDDKNTQRLEKKIVSSLFVKADQQMTTKKYTTPKRNSALNTYQRILKISPNNATARNGIKKIVEVYYQFALKKYKQEQYEGSMIWIKRGLRVMPEDSELKRLQTKVLKKQ